MAQRGLRLLALGIEFPSMIFMGSYNLQMEVELVDSPHSMYSSRLLAILSLKMGAKFDHANISI
jgi:hypothetical protein